jgi:hypothetical protein
VLQCLSYLNDYGGTIVFKLIVIRYSMAVVFGFGDDKRVVFKSVQALEKNLPL